MGVIGRETVEGRAIAVLVASCAREVGGEAALARSIVPSSSGALFASLVADAVLAGARRAIELGCMHGLSAAVMAVAGLEVYTYDVKPSPYAGPLWDKLGVREKIRHAMRPKALLHGPFDVAFIDAVHKLDDVKQDLAEVSKLLNPGALVLFDDVRYEPPILDFFASIPGSVDCGRFGYVVRS